jgi:hypothetical protein
MMSSSTSDGLVGEELDSLSPSIDVSSLTTHDYSVKQINIEPGGQVLDCKVARDEYGLPRVEMVFSLNPDISGKLSTTDDTHLLLATTGSSITGGTLHDRDVHVCIGGTVICWLEGPSAD